MSPVDQKLNNSNVADSTVILAYFGLIWALFHNHFT